MIVDWTARSRWSQLLFHLFHHISSTTVLEYFNIFHILSNNPAHSAEERVHDMYFDVTLACRGDDFRRPEGSA